MTDWTKEEDEAFNNVERQSNLGKQILKAQGQPYHWEIDAIQSAIRMERKACAKLLEEAAQAAKDADPQGFVWIAIKTSADAIRARGNHD